MIELILICSVLMFLSLLLAGLAYNQGEGSILYVLLYLFFSGIGLMIYIPLPTSGDEGVLIFLIGGIGVLPIIIGHAFAERGGNP